MPARSSSELPAPRAARPGRSHSRGRAGIALALVILGPLTAHAQAPPPPQQPWYPWPGSPPPPQSPWGQPPAPGYGPPGGHAPPPFGGPAAGYGAPPPPPERKRSTALEAGSLYVTAAGYGVGLGVWIDAEAGIDDPGIALIPPALLGVGATAGVFALDQPPMPRGMPASIAAGLFVGAGEGLGIWLYQFVSARSARAWGFTELARVEAVTATLGGAAGFASWHLQRPSPRTSGLIASSVVWGALLGSQLGYGATRAGSDYGDANDGAALGGLVGYNVGLVGAAGASMAWVPSWHQLGWMWGGFLLGEAAALPVYLFYIGSDHDARRGLVFQAIAGALGLGVGAMAASSTRLGSFAEGEREGEARGASPPPLPPRAPSGVRFLGAGLLPVEGGAGATLAFLLD